MMPPVPTGPIPYAGSAGIGPQPGGDPQTMMAMQLLQQILMKGSDPNDMDMIGDASADPNASDPGSLPPVDAGPGGPPGAPPAGPPGAGMPPMLPPGKGPIPLPMHGKPGAPNKGGHVIGLPKKPKRVNTYKDSGKGTKPPPPFKPSGK